MNKDFWEKYYKENKKDKPSEFALFAESMFKRNSFIVDIGAGNLRDTHFFENKGHTVIPIDQVLGTTIEDLLKSDTHFDVAYLRWIIHAIEPELQTKLIEWCKSYADLICIETRTNVSETYKKDHKRYPVDPIDLVNEMNGTKIVYAKQGYGMSPHPTEDPHLVRLICRTLP